MRLYDLSHPYHDCMPVYPGDDPVELRLKRTVPADGYTAYTLSTGLHAGTHLDAPLHFVAGGQMIRDLELERCLGSGRLLDVRGEKVIGYRPEYARLIGPGDIVLLWTGHSAYWNTDAYFKQHPVVQEDLADFFIERKIKLLGMDLPSPDGPPFPIHKKLLHAGIPLLENLTNLEQLRDLPSFEVIALPLNITAEGSPVRVVARAWDIKEGKTKCKGRSCG